jgi:hypothetical protein
MAANPDILTRVALLVDAVRTLPVTVEAEPYGGSASPSSTTAAAWCDAAGDLECVGVPRLEWPAT